MKRFVRYRLSLLLALSVCAIACGDDSGSPPPGDGDGDVGDRDVVGDGDIVGDVVGDGDVAGDGDVEPPWPPRRPPDPRDDLGEPDGTLCFGEGDASGVALECGASERCCLSGPTDGASTCVAPATGCDNCTASQCAVLECDGPEDCPGQLCCLKTRSCAEVGESCTGMVQLVTCEDRCEPETEYDPGTVICKDPRDCLEAGERCLERRMPPRLVTYCGF